MPGKARFIADTNVLVSRLLFRRSLPAQALDKAIAAMQIIASSETLIELGTVLSRPKFDRYLDLTQRLQFFDRLRRIAVVVSDVPPVLVCRDPKDDKFLALAVTGAQSSS